MDSQNNKCMFSVRSCDSQVAGHTALIQLDDHHLLKPCTLRETRFYKEMPKVLKDVVPICCVIIEQEYVTMGETECSTCTSDKFQNIETKLPPSILNSPFLKHGIMSEFFIVIKNLTTGMKSRRIIDLKMGRRSYSMDAPPEKIQRKTLKMLSSTSNSVAVRLSGVLYEEKGNNWRIRKTEGRAMNVNQLKDALRVFFDVSNNIQQTIKLEISKMINIVKKSSGLRLFGCSLLVAIDIERGMCGLKLIDFSNATFKGLNPGSEFEGIDENLLEGLQFVLDIINRQ